VFCSLHPLLRRIPRADDGAASEQRLAYETERDRLTTSRQENENLHELINATHREPIKGPMVLRGLAFSAIGIRHRERSLESR
jgi:hypothetical protein